MPIYDYRCLECRKRFSVRHSITKHESARVKCPKCESRKVERLIGAVFAKTSKKF